MNSHQIKYGKEKIAEYSQLLNLPQPKIIEILGHVYYLKQFFNWKNSDDFLAAVANAEITLEDS